MKLKKIFFDGIFANNPVLVQLVGMCSVLAVTTSVVNAIGMGSSVIFVVTCSNIVISSLRKFIPDKVRIPAYVVIIATFVTLVQMFLSAYIPALYDSLGLFIPLIVVNCLILARAESFASKNTVFSLEKYFNNLNKEDYIYKNLKLLSSINLTNLRLSLINSSLKFSFNEFL